MRINNLSDEETDHYELDVKNTLVANLVNFLWLILMIVFIMVSLTYINSMSEQARLLGLIVIVFATIRMSSLIHTNIQYKPRSKIKK